MSELHDFLKEEMDEQSEKTHVAMLCRIISFDSQQMKANIQPMQKGLPLIENVPVALQKAGPFFIRVPFEKGDIVVVVFADKGIDTQINTGADAEEVGVRKHDISDAIVVGGIAPFNNPLPAEDGLVIAKNDLSAKIKIDEGKKIEIYTEGDLAIEAQSVSIDCDDYTVDCGNYTINCETGSITAGGEFDITKNTDTAPESVVWE